MDRIRTREEDIRTRVESRWIGLKLETRGVV